MHPIGERTRNLAYLVRRDSFQTHFTEANVVTIVVSSKGQVVLPAELRRRLGMGAGSRLEVIEEPGGLKLRLLRSVEPVEVAGLAGMVRAPSRGKPRSLLDFDPASMLKRSRRARSGVSKQADAAGRS